MKFVYAIMITLVTGAIGGIAIAPDIKDWYTTIAKPAFNPPNYIFSPVWTALYILMGIALALVWGKPKTPERDRALKFFFTQLFLNFSWSFIFFCFHLIGWALIEIIVLWLSILYTIILFYRQSKTAAWLMVPYILWVSFATVLNAAIWNLNR